jgi:hypothetical protein
MFLNDAELRQLTGYRRPSAQRAWLKLNAIPHYVAASGRPVVLKEALHERTFNGPNGPQAHPRLRLAAPPLPARR